jgi:serine/threonine protein phosphatase PrpC
VKIAVNVQPRSGQDRAIAVPASGGYLVAVADGAGGTGGGAVAAESLIAFVERLAEDAASTDWLAALRTFDDELSAHPSGGQTTGIIAFIDREQIMGASVGDSSAYLILSSGHARELTAQQHRKPLLGSGEALPVQFKAGRLGKRVLLASDGLCKYALLERICAFASHGPVEHAANVLVDCVRLPSGSLQDDVAVVIVCE